MLGMGAAQGTYALLSTSVNTKQATVKSGTFALRVDSATWPATAPLGVFTNVAPTAPVAKSFVVTNTGSAAMDLTASITTTAGAGLRDYVTVSVRPVNTAADCTAGTRPTAPFTTFTNVPSGSLAAGASQRYCLAVWLATNTPASLSGTGIGAFTLTFDARQKAA